MTLRGSLGAAEVRAALNSAFGLIISPGRISEIRRVGYERGTSKVNWGRLATFSPFGLRVQGTQTSKYCLHVLQK